MIVYQEHDIRYVSDSSSTQLLLLEKRAHFTNSTLGTVTGITHGLDYINNYIMIH